MNEDDIITGTINECGRAGGRSAQKTVESNTDCLSRSE